MQTAHWLRRSALVLSCLFVGMAAAAFGQFAPDDEIRLRRDEPLEFKGSIYRRAGRAKPTRC